MGRKIYFTFLKLPNSIFFNTSSFLSIGSRQPKITNEETTATNELKQMELSEKNEKIEFQQWQQDRRDYDTKGEGLLKGLRYACCDTTNDEQCADMLPNETFDLIVDKGIKKKWWFLSFVHF